MLQRTMSSSRESSPGVKSQFASDDDDQDMNTAKATTSPSQLATQVFSLDSTHYMPSHPAGTRTPEYSQHMLSSQVEQPIKPLSTTQNIQALFQSRHNVTNVKVDVGEQASTQRVEQLSSKSDQPEIRTLNETDETEDENLIQTELRAPMASQQIVSEAETEKPGLYNNPKLESDIPSLVQKYALDLGMQGRLSQRMCTIPKDQALLLESSDKWFPPLIGSTVKAPTVPLALLNIFSEQADQPEIRSPSVSGAELGRRDSRISQQDEFQNGSLDQTSDTSDDPESENDDQAWPSSPPRVAVPDRLPPDSPVDNSQHIKHESSQGLHDHNSSLQVEHQPRYSNEASRAIQSTPAEQLFTQPLGPSGHEDKCRLEGQRDWATTTSIRSQEGVLAEKNMKTPSSELSKSQQILTNNIEVDRTPFLSKQENPAKVPETSTTIVPGTFNERYFSQTPASQINGVSKYDHFEGKPIQQRSFEHDSSEDGHSSHGANGESPAPASLTEAGSRRAVRSGAQGPGPENDRLPSNFSESRKRDQLEPLPNTSRHDKRRRLSGDVVPIASHDLSYHKIDAERRSQRSDFLGVLSAKSDMKSNEMLVNDLEIAGANPLPTIGLGHRAEMPNLSSKKAGRNITASTASPPLNVSISSKRGSDDFTHDTRHPTSRFQQVEDLYSRFKATYHSYKGTRKDFNASCQLLRNIRKQTSLHPSLWDAFIYRHYHDYRPYLHVVIEEAGTAVPYSDFFDSIIDPGYTRRVITLFELEAADNKEKASSVSRGGVQASSSNQTIVPDRMVGDDESPPIGQDTSAPVHDDHLTDAQVVTEDALLQSQGSTQSIQAWLDRARGAKSPILGTSEATRADENFSTLEMHEGKTTNTPSSKPQHQSIKSIWIKGTASQNHKPQQDNIVQAKREGSMVVKAKLPAPSVRHAKRKPVLVDTVFKQFARDYDKLSGGRNYGADPNVQAFVDIFRWRR